MPEQIHVATVVTTRGRHGEVAAICPSRRPDRLVHLSHAWLEGSDGERTRFELDRVWEHRGRLILHFQGSGDISSAERFVGARVYVDEEQLAPLPDGEFYGFELEGLAVEDVQGRSLGVVADVESAPGQDLLVVDTPTGQRLVPMARAIVVSVDLPGRRIVLDPPDGLLTGEPEVSVPEGTA